MSFELNSTAISADIANKDDLSGLAEAINDKSSDTGVSQHDEDGKLRMVDETVPISQSKGFLILETGETVSLQSVSSDGTAGTAVALTGATGDGCKW